MSSCGSHRPREKPTAAHLGANGTMVGYRAHRRQPGVLNPKFVDSVRRSVARCVVTKHQLPPTMSTTRQPYRIGRRFARGSVWFRRDLRLDDHAALHYALKHCARVWCVFVLDRDISIPCSPAACRPTGAWRSSASLRALDAALRAAGGGLIVRHARAAEALPALARELDAEAVFANHDYEPSARARDAAVAAALAAQSRALFHFKDRVVFGGGRDPERSGQAVRGLHTVQERGSRPCSRSTCGLPGCALRARWRRRTGMPARCHRWQRWASPPTNPGPPAAAPGSEGPMPCSTTSPASATTAAAATFRPARPQLLVGAPALRHHLHPHPGARRTRGRCCAAVPMPTAPLCGCRN